MKVKLFNIFSILRLIFYICLFLLFIIIPTSYFIENDVYGFGSIGYSPTGGVTRAFSSIMHFKFIKAFKFNPIFTLAIAPICIYIFIQDGINTIIRLITKEKKYSIIEYFLMKV